MLTRKANAFVLGALAVASAIGGMVALASGCTVLTNDGLPDDAMVFEGGEGGGDAGTCAACLTAACIAPQALCLTNASCLGVIACAAGCDGGACASTTETATDCACNASADGGPSPERLYHAYTACNDRAAARCACGTRAASTLPSCATDDAGVDADAGDTDAADAGTADADVDASADAGADTCGSCAVAKCSAQASACGGATECAAFLACSSACTTSSCVDNCGNLHATGKVAATELATCTTSNCQNDCEL